MHLLRLFLICSLVIGCTFSKRGDTDFTRKPNVIFVLADQWRAQDTGYNGNIQVMTPYLDQLANEAINFTTAISTTPVCSPARASILTGQYPLTHGVFHNDKPLTNPAITLAEIFKEEGYQTGYIGKWHLNGHPEGEDFNKHRALPVPKHRRQGFDYWKVLECAHDYNNSFYFDEDDQKQWWAGYDAKIQTDSSISFIQQHKEEPFLLFLSWGPPHNPYQTAPDEFRERYQHWENVEVRPNVPQELREQAQKELAGYYAHIAALDTYIGKLQQALKSSGLDQNTIFVFTSDHGDMIQSQGMIRKQKPYDESILVPFLLKYPNKLAPRKVKIPFVTPDIMPTLLGLSEIGVPESVEGTDFSNFLQNSENEPEITAGLIMCPVPFHEWSLERGGKEYRGIRTERYTYAKDLEGPWLLYDNFEDPYQLENLVNHSEYIQIQEDLELELNKLLAKTNDEFKDAHYYMEQWGYSFD